MYFWTCFFNMLLVSSLWTTKRKNECQQCCIHFLHISYLSIGSHFKGQSNTSACGYNLRTRVSSCAGSKEK